LSRPDWYQGTADAVRQNLRYLQDDHIRDVLILAGDQLYRMDFRRMLELHRRTAADITVSVIPTREENARQFGILRLDAEGRVIDFVEKPSRPEQLDRLRTDPAWMERLGIRPQGRHFLASMGIYLFRREVLFEVLQVRPPYTDFGKDVFPNSYRKYRVQAFLFDGYWEDLGHHQSVSSGNARTVRPRTSVRIPQSRGRDLHTDAFSPGVSRAGGKRRKLPDQ
jgi:glucose-1-phosphate adenylyltransferase